MDQSYFAEMLDTLATRAGHGTVSWLGFSNTPLRRQLLEIFARPYGETGSFLADPTFEAVFGWESAECSMSQLAGELLNPALVNAMDNPVGELASEYRFDADRRPYKHQLRAWELLLAKEKNSVIVTSGTGSGKTECFVVPILNQLANEYLAQQTPLIGVRALFLYPLNALINSQRDRLRAWTQGLNQAARFCLYNGNTPEALPATEARIHNELRDRQTLRREPPPILVTNASMLEYMLVRTQDLPILQSSQGKLQWIILDEAHSYVGSQAAELALLIRRVLYAFGVKSKDVRFVATSATIGGPEATASNNLREFLARVSGNDIESVYVVSGGRNIPSLPQVAPQKGETSFEELFRIDEGKDPSPNRYAALASHPTAKRIRELFTSQKTNPVGRLSDILPLVGNQSTVTMERQKLALRWLDLLSSTIDSDGTPFLPLRSHLFHQTLAGLWCCADRNCPGRKGSRLDDELWPFGILYLQHRKFCKCGSPVYELVACDDCAAIFLRAEIDGNRVLPPATDSEEDEFALDIKDSDFEEDEFTTYNLQSADHSDVLITNRDLPNCGELIIEKQTGLIVEKPGDESIPVTVFENVSERVQCPNCDEESNRFDDQFRTARVGAPFYLAGVLPTLLEFAPDGEDPMNRTYRGRRLLTFTDSRQGTARLAARLQQDSERTKTRGLIYHNILANTGASPEDLEKLHALELIPNPTAPILNLISDMRVQIEQASSVKFHELLYAIQQGGAEFDSIRSSYATFSRETFGTPEGSSNMAEVLIVREMGRRPKRQNNLETMGLVAIYYPKLLKVTFAPSTWISRGLTLAEWRDFLKIALDFFVRGGGSLEMREVLRPWLGLPQRLTRLVSSSSDEVSRSQRRWPSVLRSGDRSRLVRLLVRILHVDVHSPEGQDTVDATLQAAWEEVQKILNLTPDGYVLPLREMSFRLIREAWICPFTRRLLDTCVRGVSPYLPRGPLESKSMCSRVVMPVYDAPFGNRALGEDSVRRGRAWLESNATVKELREDGLWSIFHDRVIEFAMYFSAAEHSAQQPSAKLQAYEKRFKEGRINILSCSTTMEMGIDIGGVQQVAMNNVPPHPANYLQRAGRAGRRSEARSSALTLCKSNPHDQNVFLNTRWPFDTLLPPPVISLNSPIIVQRHINAIILAQFLRNLLIQQQQEIHKLTCGWFFLAPEGPVPANNFHAWAQAYMNGSSEAFENGLKQAIRRTSLEGVQPSQLLRTCSAHIESVMESWYSEWNALVEQEGGIGSDPAEPALKAIGFQKKRLSNEYLLRELSTTGFLPAYGFPTFVASFDNLTISGLRNLSSQSEDRVDNRYLRRELASRDLATALREYAPGSDVVIDGLVYRSAGITLNWHIPASEADARETQAIKFAWRCTKCGASGTSVVMAKSCDACGSELENIEKFLEPAGFSVDFYKDPDNNVSSPTYIPVERPWVSARGNWSSLPNPNLGRFRTTVDGRVYQRSAGVNGTGYAICLRCGRAEPLLPAGKLPKEFEPGQVHLKLRGKKVDRACSGSNNRWAIVRTVLGHELRTDMLELQLCQTDGQPLNDRAASVTIAVALRDALAELIGVQSSELGCDAREAVAEVGGRCHSIFIFDRFAAGYASSAEKFLSQMFHKAVRLLDCPKKCDSCCPNCVLDFDQRFQANLLDRKAALRILGDAWMKQLRLPEELQYFGPSSQVETTELALAAIRESRNSGTVRLFAGGPLDMWDFAASPLRALAYRLLSMSRQVEIVIHKDLIARLPEEDRHSLAALADHPGATVRGAGKPRRAREGYVISEVVSGNDLIGWACDDPAALTGSSTWGLAVGSLIRGHIEDNPELGDVCDSKCLRPAPLDLSDREISIHHQLDGALQTYGSRFWMLLRREHAATDLLFKNSLANVLSIQYSDRYLFTPLSIAILRQVLAGFRDLFGMERFGKPSLNIRTMGIRKEGKGAFGAKVYADWPSSQVRDMVTELVMQDLGTVKLDVSDQSVQHSRELKIEFTTGGSLGLRFDQGVSYWRVGSWSNIGGRANCFDFACPNANIQAKTILALDVAIEGANAPTQIFAKARKRS